jgi:hypothetical protein
MKTSWPELGEEIVAKAVIEIPAKAVIAVATVAAAMLRRGRTTNFDQKDTGLLRGEERGLPRSERDALFEV